MNQIKLIFCDLDGTLLLKPEKFPDPNFYPWLSFFHRQGIRFIIITGRLIEEALLIFHKIGVNPELSPYIIACNGAQVYDTKQQKLITNLELEKKIVQDIFAKFPRLIQQFPYLQGFLFTSQGQIRAYPSKDVLLQTITSYPPLDDRQLDNPNSPSVILHDRIIPDQLSALTLVDGQHLNKVVFTLYHGDFYQLKSFCQQEFTIPGLHVTFSSNHSIELSNIAHTKGLALKEIAQKLKVPLNQILALGDAGNDISMLSIPGITAVCASWSQPEVLAVSSHHFPGKAGTWILNAFQQLLVKDHQKGIE